MVLRLVPLFTSTSGPWFALAFYRVFIELKMLVVLLTGCRSYFATEERLLRYGGALGNEMTRDAELRVTEELVRGRPTLAFDAYRPTVASS